MASKDEYVFSRDFLDDTRINLMHHLWTRFFGYTIHPKIPIESANLKVADIGTGTGMWLLDVAEKLPKETQLDGFDISFDAAPPSEILPTNVKFRHWNVRDPVPEDLVGVYDIVHIRFFGYVLRNDEIPGVAAKLFSLLKPGGYLQWGEADMQSLRFENAKPDGKTQYLTELYDLLKVDDRLKPTWVRNLPEILSSSGFVDVEMQDVDPQPHLAYIFHEASLIMHNQFARRTKSEHLAREVKRLLPLVVDEVKQGAWGTSLRCTAIGRKP
ncbi:S-adenosyl-L-methionine-dependent methyltransferase [Hypoxylon rubiginosum]|uniref:S-adenosyl-L-methionine-dependent methyltransferase n=1 Tax=Hypoxylon rubiginosum TaxID=110542 RepID=A0ACC0CSK9_9PEZI|nr:S-adenosyl-L-methionine-dependent methyltransferase [Hypoxylon rubiginosum]